MAIQFGQQDEDEIIGLINTTPLVDVMLVLLIIFLITIPVVTTSVRVDLPQQTHVRHESQPGDLTVSIDKNGRIYLRDTVLPDTQALYERIREQASLQPQPAVQIRGDAGLDFASVARVMNAVQRAGMARVSFITEPKE